MSELITVAEFVYACSHEKCRYKQQRFNSIESLNMHFSKKHHDSARKFVPDGKGHVYLRLK